jgi:glutamate racemase
MTIGPESSQQLALRYTKFEWSPVACVRRKTTSPMDRSNPKTTIGVFDSGMGGLTVLKSLLEVVPNANYLYFGDTARLPYGSKSAEMVAKYALGATDFLENQGANLLVIACNTATALAFNQIAQAAHVPVVGVVEPGAEHAASASKKRKVVVIGTEATVNSHAYSKALEARGVQAREKACPLFVPLVEEGWAEHSVTEQVARIYLDEAFSEGFESADVLVLGCTHYPLIKSVLDRMTLPGVEIVDSAESTARVVAEKLGIAKPEMGGGEKNPTGEDPALKFFATDSVEKFRRLGAKFLGRPIDFVQHVNLKE